MAISVDSVYQKVLAVANKEQRGYITPQEFNLFADHAQMEIFEQYFYDTNQAIRLPGNNSEYHDVIDLIDEKLYVFKRSDGVSNGDSVDAFPNLYRVGDVYLLQSGYTPNTEVPFGNSVCVEEIRQGDLIKTQSSPLTRATNDRPIYYMENNEFRFFPQTAPNGGSYRIYYIAKPAKPNWTYIISGESALFNPDINAGWQDFELHSSEENLLVMKILQLAGVNMKDANLVQLVGQKELSVTQQQKQ